MSEDEQEKFTLTDDLRKVLTERAPDGLLEEVVSITNRMADGRGMNITLQVKGVIVTGDMIANWLWADLINERLSAAPPANESPFAHWSEELKASRDLNTERDAKWNELTLEEQRALVVDSTSAFIHLEKAHYVAAGHMMPEGGTLWRARLSQVDAWTFGRLSPGQN